MSFSYDPTLPTDKDHVRFLIADTLDSPPTASAFFQDEEIIAVLSEETATGKALKYFAAARCLGILSTRWAASGRGLSSKTVSRLSLAYGVSGSSLDIINARIQEMRQRGAYLLNPNASYPFRIAGGSMTRVRPL